MQLTQPFNNYKNSQIKIGQEGDLELIWKAWKYFEKRRDR